MNNENALAFFKQSVSILVDVDEPDADWRNRLGWAWYALGEFAEEMGPAFLTAAKVAHDSRGMRRANARCSVGR